MRYQPIAAAAAALSASSEPEPPQRPPRTWDFGADPDTNMNTAANWDTATRCPCRVRRGRSAPPAPTPSRTSVSNSCATTMTFNRNFGPPVRPILLDEPRRCPEARSTSTSSLPITLNVGTSSQWTDSRRVAGRRWMTRSPSVRRRDTSTLGEARHDDVPSEAQRSTATRSSSWTTRGTVNLLGGGNLDAFSSARATCTRAA